MAVLSARLLPGVARLDLARGDTTGQWMLDYAFPYDSAPVQQAVRDLAIALGQALDRHPGARGSALKTVVSARERCAAAVTAADYRYFEFQLWQEGVARFIEYAAARAASADSGKPSAASRGSPTTSRTARPPPRRAEACDGSWSTGAGPAAAVAFYPLGAAMAFLLEETRPGWKRAYGGRPFALAALLPATR